MTDKEDNKSLIKLNGDSIFTKIKNFFKRIFGLDKSKEDVNDKNEEIIEDVEVDAEENPFIESIKIVESEETKLLYLQKQFRRGEIKENQLTTEQIKDLCALYDKQIEALRRSNEARKQKLLELRKDYQTDN